MSDLESDNLNKQSQNISDKLLFFAERLSFILIFIPFLSIILWIFLRYEYFFFFPIAMFTFLPTGVFALLIQRIKIFRKHPYNELSSFIYGMSILATGIGILAYMAIYVVTG